MIGFIVWGFLSLVLHGETRSVVDVFDWVREGAICAGPGREQTREIIRRSATTGWSWGGYNHSKKGAANIEAGGQKIIFRKVRGQNANIPGSYVYTIFSSQGTARPDQSFNLSRVGAAFKIRAETVAPDQALRWLIRDGRGDWYVSYEITWPRRLPISKKPGHFWTFPVSLYSWVRVKNTDLNILKNGGERFLQVDTVATPDMAAVTGMGIHVARSNGAMPLVISGLGLSEYEPIVYAPPDRATHWFTGPNALRVGLGNLSGGVFNEMYWGVYDPATQREINIIPGMNGRAVNFAFRSQYHGGVWNPIQSGHWEEFGRPVDITVEPSSVGNGLERFVWNVQPMPLWHGDGRYDFSQYEDLTYGHPYDDNPPYTDADGLPETGLSQAHEIISDFDLGGYVENASLLAKDVLILRIVQYADFIRLTGNTLQFNAGGVQINGVDSVINPKFKTDDISAVLPGNQPSTETDMTHIPVMWSDRFDREYANMKWLWIWEDGKKQWNIVSMDEFRKVTLTESTLTLIADSGDPADAATCRAVGLYYPVWSEINKYPIVGVETATGGTVYREARFAADLPVSQFAGWRANNRPTGENKNITANYTMRALRINLKGILSPDHTLVGCHERLQKENFWIFGTPAAVLNAVQSIDRHFASEAVPSAPGKARLLAMKGDPLIVNGASGASLAASLYWWPGVRSESSEVYLGNDEQSVNAARPGDPEYRGSIKGREYHPDSLKPGTTYYWRVDTTNETGVTKGDIWSFTTRHH
jgi:hypothetical protein